MTQKGIGWICLKGNITIKVRSDEVKNSSGEDILEDTGEGKDRMPLASAMDDSR